VKRPWLAYLVTALVAAAAGLAIAGVPSTPPGTTVTIGDVDPAAVTTTVPAAVAGTTVPGTGGD
jgi:hypothetical protein